MLISIDGFKEIRKKKKLALRSEQIMEQVKSDLDQVYNNLSVLDQTLSLRDKSQSRERTHKNLSKVLAKTLLQSNLNTNSENNYKWTVNNKIEEEEGLAFGDEYEDDSDIQIENMARSSEFVRPDVMKTFRNSAERLGQSGLQDNFNSHLVKSKRNKLLDRSIEINRNNHKKRVNYIKNIKPVNIIKKLRGFDDIKRINGFGSNPVMAKKRSKSKLKPKFNMAVLNHAIKKKKSYLEKNTVEKEQRSYNHPQTKKDKSYLKKMMAIEKDIKKKRIKYKIIDDKKNKGENFFNSNKMPKRGSKRFSKFSYNAKVESKFFLNKFTNNFNKPTMMDVTLSKYKRLNKAITKRVEGDKAIVGGATTTSKEKVFKKIVSK